MRVGHVFTVLIAGGIALAITALAEASGPPFELTVKKDHAFGASRGTVIFTVDGAEYRTNDTDDARRWTYEDIKQVQISSPTRLSILTYEDRGGLRFGADRTFEFEIVQGGIAPDLIAFLLDRVPRPVVTSVLPPTPAAAPVFRVSVKHQRAGRGSEGTLALYDDGLVYQTERERHARYWRLSDVYSVLRVDRYRLEVVTYEGGSSDTHRFLFELKGELPQSAYEALWVRVNPPTYELRREQTARIAEPPR